MPENPDPDPNDPAAVQAINADASAVMQQGIALMASGAANDLREAVACFDRALDMRRRLPLDTQPLLRFGLAACWLNRADALVRLRDGTQLAAALESYDAGIALLHTLPFAEDSRYPRRLAIAHQNRGLALQSRDGAAAAAAVEAFMTALATLDHPAAAAIPDRAYLAAAIWVNVANAQVAAGTPDAAVLGSEAARRAMPLVAAAEDEDPGAAEITLRGRHVRCQAVAVQLGTTDGATAGIPEAVHEATDLVDEGLALVRRWEKRGVTRFRELAFDLFRFGARLYAWYQPQFLDEFVRENIDPELSSEDYTTSPPVQFAAREALDLLRPAGETPQT